jgi:hypothetical protein
MSSEVMPFGTLMRMTGGEAAPIGACAAATMRSPSKASTTKTLSGCAGPQ